MSTLMSKDLNLTRPSSRVNRPPGGATSISFGDYDSSKPAAKPAAAAPEPVAPVVEPVVEKVVEVVDTSYADGKKVGIVVGGKIEPDTLSGAILKALKIAGIETTAVTVSKVPTASVLAYAAQNMAKKCDVVIATAFITGDTTGAVTQSIQTSLLQIGVAGTTPIIPALISQSSLLEAKALLPDIAEEVAEATLAALNIENMADEPAPEVVVPVKPVYTAAEKSVDTLIDLLRESAKSHGASGIIGIGRKFRIVDDDNSGTIDLAEFTKMINEHGLGWTTEQIKIVYDKFDQDKAGGLSYDEFLEALRGDMNDRRKQMVLMAFEILDADKSGVVELNDLQGKYNGKKHPDVIAGRKTEDEILSEFLDTFDTIDKDGKVTVQEFIKYYGSLSASIDNDDYFELMMRNAWHISGGEGWCANTSCRRVLVTHADGHQSVQEIKNDLGIAADDKEAMMKKLKEQGVDDVVSIDTKGSSQESSIAPATTAPPTPDRKNTVAGVSTKDVAERPATAPTPVRSRHNYGKSSLVIG